MKQVIEHNQTKRDAITGESYTLAVVEETLSDNSKVYNVLLTYAFDDKGKSTMTEFMCETLDKALALFVTLDSLDLFQNAYNF